MMKTLMMAAGLAVALCGAAFGAVEMQQGIVLEKGWNAVHVQVADTNDVDDLFKDWPVEWVSLYKSDAFLETRQFSAEGSNEGVISSGYRTWWRGKKDVRGFARVPADSVLVCFATNAHSCVLYGTPAAPRIAWHISKGEDGVAPLNLVGLSVASNAETTIARYFSGKNVNGADVFVFGGGETNAPEKSSVERMGPDAKFANAQVLAVASSEVSDWSGVLYVSPRDGLAFGGEVAKGLLEVRNDGATNVIATVGMSAGKSRPGENTPQTPPGLYARDSLDALTNGPWTAFTDATTLRRELLAGETWEITFAIDLLQLGEGTEYGAILEIRDETRNGSAMCVHVPLTAARDGASAEFAWPKGVWSAVAELDTVNFMVTSEDNGTFKKADEGMKKAGGKMTVRLPLYVDEKGEMTLLQRLWFGRDTNGVLRAYSGAVTKSNEPLSDVQRLSTPFLPTDQPKIAFSSGTVFGPTARAAFIVGRDSKVNPMRHAQHPQHDGLTADYRSDAPNGDNLNSYIGLVKPETFSISNRIEFAWDESDAARWNPAETLTGTLTWEFDGLRHEGTVRAMGKFAMKRLSPVTVEDLR